MAVPILVVTSNAGFGELIEQVLRETGHFAIARASDQTSALRHMRDASPSLAILDCNQDEATVRELALSLRERKPDLLLVFITPADERYVASLNNLHPDGMLAKPFYLPDMIDTVEDIVNFHALHTPRPKTPKKKRKVTGPLRMPSSAPSWLGDVTLVGEQLTLLTQDSASDAALITNGDVLWAYAGALPQPAAEELARIVAQHFSEDVTGDLARYVRLETLDNDLMVYGHSLGGEFVLATIFDSEMPFTRVRTQAAQLARALAEQPAPELSAATSGDDSHYAAQAEDAADGPPQPLWDDIPTPNLPAAQPQPVPVMQAAQVQVDEEAPAHSEGVIKTLPEYIAETMVSRSREGQGLDITQPSKSQTDFKKALKLAPASPILYDLTYACVLVPRMPDHFLTGDLATKLSTWVTQLSLAFGWRLEQLAIRPEYLQWMANVPPKTSPGYLMRIMRDHTSRRIFGEYPRFSEQNPSGDFWAPGYLIMASNQTPPQHLVTEFIQETRTRQGIHAG